MKIILFGAGENARRFIRYSPAAKMVEIVGIVDNDSSKWGNKFEDRYVIEKPEIIRNIEWDIIVVCFHGFDEIFNQLGNEYQIDRKRMICVNELIVPSQSNLGTVRLDCNYDEYYNVNELMPDKVIASNQFEEFYFHRHHRIMNKWWHYFEIYDTFFSKFKNRKIRFLEIGVYKGGSMQMWKEYFGKGSTIVGIDIDDSCKEYEEEHVHICIGSQADREFLEQVSKEYGPFDIILDDGSHQMEHQIITFETLFPLLKENGIFICEDCHCAYSARYGGAYKKEGTFIEYSKNFADYVNSQFIDFDEKDKLPFYADDIKACHYYDSMVVVEKAHRGYSFVTEFSQ